MEKTFEQLIWNKKFPKEEFNADDFYDLIAENKDEYLDIALEIGNLLLTKVEVKDCFINFLKKQ